jgi:hypothetical protein
MAKTGGKRPEAPRSLAQMAASLDTKKRPLPPQLQRSAAEASELLKSKSPEVLESVPRSEALGTLAAVPASELGSPARKTSGRRGPSSFKVRLAPAEGKGKTVEATVPASSLSVGGAFLRTSAALKLGAKLVATVLLPQGREARLKGEVVRVERVGKGEPAVALRFTEYVGGAEKLLVSEVLAPALEEFLHAHAEAHGYQADPEYVAHTVDVLAAWELRKAERGGDVWDATDDE